eukprot:c6567_g1_i1.p1 GENE.c6567_g1_i1~~c6567_g1_i1.p1  ORF type:complete len:145 (-),score=38.98 c6567_g1_i1:316-708(-)
MTTGKSYFAILLICVIAQLVRESEAVTCVECADIVDKMGGFCEKQRVNKFTAFCRDAPYYSTPDKIRSCVRVSQGVSDHAEFVLGTSDACKAVDNIQGTSFLQHRLQICCGPLVQCDSGGQGFSVGICGQ